MLRRKILIIFGVMVICIAFITISSYGLMKTKLVDNVSESINANANANANADTNNTIPISTAQQEFMKYGSPQLMYVRPWNSSKVNDNRKLKLVYSIVRGPYYYLDFKGIDAVTSKPLTLNNDEFNLANEKLGENRYQFNPLNRLTIPLTEVAAKDKSIKEALKYGITIDDSYNYESHYNDNWMSLNEAVYQISFSKNDNGIKHIINVVIDINNGAILKFANNDNVSDSDSDKATTIKNNSDAKAILNWSQSKDIAIAFAKNNFPEYADSTILIQNIPTESENKYYFIFLRNVGGIIYPENNITVTIDAVAKAVIGFGYRWENITFPVVDNSIISQQAANKIFIDKIGISLFNNDSPNSNTNANSPNLIYRSNLSDAAYIDCYSGELKNSFGQTITK